MTLQITVLYSAILALFLIALSMNVIKARVAAKVALLDGGDDRLTRAIRVHANFIEYVPFMLFLMLIIEINGAPQLVLHAAGVLIIITRLLHISSMLYFEIREKRTIKFRRMSIQLTFLILFALANFAIFQII